MAAAIFLGFFLILGLGVVGVAMRGGPRGVRDTLEVGRRKPLRAAEFLVAGLIALFGIAVPRDRAARRSGVRRAGRLHAHTGRAGGPPAVRPEVRDLPHAQGRRAPSARSVPNLDVLNPPLNLTLDAIQKGRAGNGQMPAQLVETDDAKKIAKYLADVAGR